MSKNVFGLPIKLNILNFRKPLITSIIKLTTSIAEHIKRKTPQTKRKTLNHVPTKRDSFEGAVSLLFKLYTMSGKILFSLTN